MNRKEKLDAANLAYRDRLFEFCEQLKLAVNHNQQELERIGAMTKPTRETMRAELARAMGYKVRQWATGQFQLLDPSEKSDYNFWGTEKAAWESAPNPFTDAAASRALVEWLRQQPNRISSRFIAEIFHMKWPELPIFISAERMDIHMIWGLLSLPLETIALAAWRAIQETSQNP